MLTRNIKDNNNNFHIYIFHILICHIRKY